MLLAWLAWRMALGCGPQQEYALSSPSGDPPPSEHLRFIKRYTDTMLELFAGEDSPYCYDWIEDEDERRGYVKSRWCRMVDPSNPIDQERAEWCLEEMERRLQSEYDVELEPVDYDCALCNLEQLRPGQKDACQSPRSVEDDVEDTGDTGLYGCSRLLVSMVRERLPLR